jgi:ribulose kinase
MPNTVIAVDVGSRQVRAGLFDMTGFMLLSATEVIAPAQHGEAAATYQMDEIWDAVCLVVRHCARGAEDHDVKVIGLAFDATSSLYVDRCGASLGEGEGDVFGWMDHRAQAEALEIDATGHPYLAHLIHQGLFSRLASVA